MVQIDTSSSYCVLAHVIKILIFSSENQRVELKIIPDQFIMAEAQTHMKIKLEQQEDLTTDNGIM